MTIRTVAVSGVTAVNFNSDGKRPYFYASEKYVWIKNNSDAAMYVSLDENCVTGAVGTALISSGECGRIELSSENTLYISGSGNAEIRTGDTAECPFKAAGKGGGSGTGNYADLVNKPMINDVVLTGNKSFADLGLNTVNEPTAREIADGIAAIWG